jgi:hypothetical protein
MVGCKWGKFNLPAVYYHWHTIGVYHLHWHCQSSQKMSTATTATGTGSPSRSTGLLTSTRGNSDSCWALAECIHMGLSWARDAASVLRATGTGPSPP